MRFLLLFFIFYDKVVFGKIIFKGGIFLDENENFRHPEKWRETRDPFSLPYKSFRLCKILGYPHAGNDVFHAKGFVGNEEVTVYIKAARRKDAAIKNDVEMMRAFPFECVPEVIDCGFGEIPFSVTRELPGRRLSVIVGENEEMLSLRYMKKYGKALAKIHGIKNIDAKPVCERKFHLCPTLEELEKAGFSSLAPFFERKPGESPTVFCHGDFHYANILWQNEEISAILDFELAGFGNRDFDIAWAVALRPGQKFFRTEKELSLFLEGYSEFGNYNAKAVRYYMAQIYIHFLQFCQNDKDYCEYVSRWLFENCI